MFYIQTTATVSGSRRKLVRCSGCGEQYEYVARREGWGNSYRLPFAFRERTDREALARAKKHLAFTLERAVDPVPCPHCGILQANMIRSKTHEKEKTILLIVGVIVAIILFAVYQSLKTGHP